MVPMCNDLALFFGEVVAGPWELRRFPPPNSLVWREGRAGWWAARPPAPECSLFSPRIECRQLDRGETFAFGRPVQGRFHDCTVSSTALACPGRRSLDRRRPVVRRLLRQMLMRRLGSRQRRGGGGPSSPTV